MRNFAVSIAFAFAAFALPAQAQQTAGTFLDPGGRLTFSYPAGWTVQVLPSDNAGAVRAFAGSADFECQVWSLPTPGTADDSADVSRQRYSRPRTTAQWREMVASLPSFSGDDVQVTDQRIDEGRTWPIEHVVLHGGGQAMRGTFQGRPGLELLSLCMSFDGQDRDDVFAQIEASIDSTVR